MLKADFLLDNFHAKGENESEFSILTREIDSHTCYYPVEMKKLAVFSRAAEKYQRNAPDECTVYVFWPGNPWVKGAETKPQIASFETMKVLPNIASNKEYDAKLYAEMVSTNSMFLYVTMDKGGSICHVSSLAMSTLAQRLGVSATAIGDRSFAADCLIAEKLNQAKSVKLVIKSYRRIGKVFAAMSPKYAELPLHDLCTIYKDLFVENPDITKITDDSCIHLDQENVTCDGWDITHERARISFSFNGYAKDINETYQMKDELIPCLELVTSDIGENSFEATGYWKTPRGSKIYGTSFKREHRETTRRKNDVTGDSFCDVVTKGVKENIFDQYTVLPERLLELLQIDITPSDADLTKARGRGRNAKAITAAFKHVFRELKLSAILSAKRTKRVFDEYLDRGQIDDSMRYTAYDIAMKVFELDQLKPWLEHDGVCQETIRKFCEAIGKAAYVDFTQFTSHKTNENISDVFAVPQDMFS